MAVPIEREIIRGRFIAICAAYEPWNSLAMEHQTTIVRRIERECFAETINSCVRDGIDRLFADKKFTARYSTACSKVMANLDINGSVGSTYLIDRLISGEITPQCAAQSSSMELCPSANATQRDNVAARLRQKPKPKVSRQYTCRKCHGNETIPISYQSRAADEDGTISIKCVNCYYVWRR